MAIFLLHIAQSPQAFHQLFMDHLSLPVSQHLLDVLCPSRALDGLGSPPLLLLGDVILKQTAGNVVSKKWARLQGASQLTLPISVPCIRCFFSQSLYCLSQLHLSYLNSHEN